METNKRFLLIGLLVAAAAVTYALLLRGGEKDQAGSLPSLEERREAFLMLDRKTATPDEQRLHMQEAHDLAVRTNAVEVGSCSLEPSIVQVAATSTITFRNGSTEAAGISLEDVPYNIPAGESRAVKVSAFGKQDRLYGYGCSSPAGGAPGFILVR